MIELAVFMLIFFGLLQKYRSTRINALEALKYIYGLLVGFIWAQEYIERHERYFKLFYVGEGGETWLTCCAANHCSQTKSLGESKH